MTELADTLARDHGLPFKAGHAIAARLIASARSAPERPLSLVLAEVSREIAGREVVYSESQLAELLSPKHFVTIRTTYGGPAPSETLRAIGVSRTKLHDDESWLRATREKLQKADTLMRTATAAL